MAISSSCPEGLRAARVAYSAAAAYFSNQYSASAFCSFKPLSKSNLTWLCSSPRTPTYLPVPPVHLAVPSKVALFRTILRDRDLARPSPLRVNLVTVFQRDHRISPGPAVTI